MAALRLDIDAYECITDKLESHRKTFVWKVERCFAIENNWGRYLTCKSMDGEKSALLEVQECLREMNELRELTEHGEMVGLCEKDLGAGYGTF